MHLDANALSVCLAKIKKSAYFAIQFIFATIHEPTVLLVLFMGPTVLFYLTFTFIYSTYSKKFSISVK